MEWIDVVDSAVKIGLGALIAGFATYMTTKAGGKIEKDKLKLENKLLLIQDACQHIEAGFSDIEKFVGYLTGEMQRLNNSGVTSPDQVARNVLYRLKDFDDLLVSGKASLIKGISKITLAGLDIEDERLKKSYGLSIYRIRDNLVFNEQLPSITSLHQEREKIAEKHILTQQKLADFYTSINK